MEGSVGRIEQSIMARLRNELFHSIAGINNAIRRALDDFNSKPFQKRSGSRNSVFEIEEKPRLRALPEVPFEVCAWSYGHKVANNSHVWFEKGQYSVPHTLVGQAVDVKYSDCRVYVYHERSIVAVHDIIPRNVKNGRRTKSEHLKFPSYEADSVESVTSEATAVGPSTLEVVSRLYEGAKVKEQMTHSARAILNIMKDRSPADLERACCEALKHHRFPRYKDIVPHLDSRGNDCPTHSNKKSSGMVRGPHYYKRSEQP